MGTVRVDPHGLTAFRRRVDFGPSPYGALGVPEEVQGRSSRPPRWKATADTWTTEYGEIADGLVPPRGTVWEGGTSQARRARAASTLTYCLCVGWLYRRYFRPRPGSGAQT